jgi:hypothetical protein
MRVALAASLACGSCGGGAHLNRRAEHLCQRAVANEKTSAPATVGEVRSWRVGADADPSPTAFAGQKDSDFAAWCWTGANGNFTVYAVDAQGASFRYGGTYGLPSNLSVPSGPPVIP